MTLLPIIERELRIEARHRFTYWLRLLGAGAMLLVALFFAFDSEPSSGHGAKLFAHLHLTLFCAIWIFVPLVTADCISRERREGTLGLLFLTPLKAWDIVVAKGLAHGLRAATLCIAVLPVLTIPFLMGGVSWKEGTMSCLINVSAFCWALAAGLWASSRSKVWLHSVLMAAIDVCIGLSVLVTVNFFSVIAAVSPYVPGFTWSEMWEYLGNSEVYEIMADALALIADWNGEWGDTTAPSLPNAGQLSWLAASCAVTLFSLLALLWISRLAARNVRRHWQEEPPSARRLWWRQTFCTPVLLLKFFRRWMRRKLERNPIGWLEQRTWSGRLVTWGWLAAMVSLYSAALSIDPVVRNELYRLQRFLGWLLALSIAASAAGSFRRERETGVLELLLVAPLTEGQIIGGRLRGLWAQFLPAFVLLAGVSLYLGRAVGSYTYSVDEGRQGMQLLWLQTWTFMTLPVIGLYFSLARSHFVSALLGTLFVGILLPLAMPRLWLFLHQLLLGLNPQPLLLDAELFRRGDELVFIAVFQLAFAGLAGYRLHRNLVGRDFRFLRAPS